MASDGEREIAAIRDRVVAEIRAADSVTALDDVRVRVLGRSGELTLQLRAVGALPASERPAAGKALNQARRAIEALLDERRASLESAAISGALHDSSFDFTLPATPMRLGTLHPISRIQYQIEDIFTSMGFAVLDGPEVESDYYNFEALNIPKNHPARDMQDTFYLEDGNLLRTHTSPVQVRAMEVMRPPIRAIAPGRVFRYEVTDASHENTFYQVEGLMVDEDISVANLIAVMKTMLREVFERDVTVRLRPGYFPFVEPGFELDIRCFICEGKGCAVCKRSGWVELMPCGMVHPAVLRYGRIDPDRHSGFAFGLGLNRLVMMRYRIDDIRLFLSGDLRFLEQF
ncbi:MAG: phenylalanine--tRNA ligase subunit alpha [Planctomycetes bacterium]|nr:phenylalanine--tRNA ligase subunit alpha [Planctomycetota bacterium]MBI3846775.1 phenylalanine--tRNA ligase subunit alpha [Planctomycetota bacterium]